VTGRILVWEPPHVLEHDLNRLGFRMGAGAQTGVDADSDDIHPADLRTCRHFGQRVATVTRQLVAGRLATAI